MKRKRTYCDDCRVLYSDKYHKITDNVAQLKKEGWTTRHYYVLTSLSQQVKFHQEVYWFDPNAKCHYEDADYRHETLEIASFSSEDLSEFAKKIKASINKHCDGLFGGGHLGNGKLVSTGKKKPHEKSYYCHLYVLVKKIKK